MSKTVIREAKSSDCGKILALMQELATELHVTTSSKLTCKDLENDAFGETPICTGYVCQTHEGDIIAYALVYYTYSTWEGRSVCLEELFVVPSQRRNGIGSSLLKKVVQIALEKGFCRCNINTLSRNEFLVSQGAIDLTEVEKWLFFRMNQEAMEVFVKNCKSVGVEIREAAKNDYAGIRKLIQDLADYEKIPDGPKISASTLEEDGQGDRPFYRCFVAEADGEMIGYSLFFYTYNGDGPGIYMEDLYVSPEHRSKGIGMGLWGSVIKAGLDIGGKRCDFAVLDWNTPSIDFYKVKGAVDMTQKKGFHFYRMTKDAMQKYVKVQ